MPGETSETTTNNSPEITIQYSTDLKEWHDLTTTRLQDTVQITDTNDPSNMRFYRVKGPYEINIGSIQFE